MSVRETLSPASAAPLNEAAPPDGVKPERALEKVSVSENMFWIRH
jgi:hypothetical protein